VSREPAQVELFIGFRTSTFLVGAPGGRISTLARDMDADLIVTVSHHPTFIGRLFSIGQSNTYPASGALTRVDLPQ
jgi:hypothetical protein